jgi:hypothetical protein
MEAAKSLCKLSKAVVLHVHLWGVRQLVPMLALLYTVILHASDYVCIAVSSLLG